MVTELLSEKHTDMVAEYADIIQIGARNAQNFQLLMAAAKTGKPVLLKRGLSMRIEEWLLAGEYVLSSGNSGLLFCERGIRTFETYTRNTLDLCAVPIVKAESHLPVVVDPSQGSGRADLVAAACRGAVAMGADALLIEVHPNPREAWSDGASSTSERDSPMYPMTYTSTPPRMPDIPKRSASMMPERYSTYSVAKIAQASRASSV